MDSKHILVAEDETHTRFTMTLILRISGFNVTSTKEGRTALKIIKERMDSTAPVDLLVTDIQMAGLNGLNLIEELGKARIHIPVIIITGWGHEEKVIELKRKENIDCIEKPFVPQELIDLVKKSFARTGDALSGVVTRESLV